MDESEILKMLEEQNRLINRQTRILVEIAEMINTTNLPDSAYKTAELKNSLNIVKSIARDEIY